MDFIACITIIFFFTAFVKFVTVLTAVKYGLGLNGLSFTLVMIIFSLLLSVFTLSGYVSDSEQKSILFIGKNKLDTAKIFEKLTPYIDANTDQSLLARLSSINKSIVLKAKVDIKENTEVLSNPNSIVKLLAFCLTQINIAFKIAFVVLLPLILIDLLVIHSLKLLAIDSYDPVLLALPLKLLLFYSIDGFTLIGEKLLNGVV